MARGYLLIFAGLAVGWITFPADAQEAVESACLDFSSPQEAQAFFETEGGPEHDPHGLDSDGNGVACDGVDVGVLAESGNIVLAQGTTPDPNSQGPPGQGQTASPTPTTPGASPTSTATPATPTPSALPLSGGPVETYGITGGVLVLGGLLMSRVARSRRAEQRKVDEYSLIGW